MKILTRYILSQFFKIFFTCIFAFIVFFLIIDIFENYEKFIENPVPFGIIVSYFFSKIPFMIFVSLPMAVLLAVLISLGLMGQNLELVAIQTSGASYSFIVTPILIVSLLLSILSFIANEYVVPKTNYLTEYLSMVKIKKRKMDINPEFQLDKIWMKRGNTIYNIERYHPGDQKLEGITIYIFSDKFSLKKRYVSEYAEWNGNQWEFFNVTEYDFSESGNYTTEKFETLYLDIKEKPNDFKIVFEEETESMSYRSLARYIRNLEKDGYNASRYKVDLMGKISYPFVNFIMALIAIPFALLTGRRGGITSGVVIALVVALSYWVIHSICLSLGHAGTFPPFIAAWTANLLYMIIGGYLILALRS